MVIEIGIRAETTGQHHHANPAILPKFLSLVGLSDRMNRIKQDAHKEPRAEDSGRKSELAPKRSVFGIHLSILSFLPFFCFAFPATYPVP